MVGVSAGMHDPVKCVGVGEKSSRSQWLATTGDRKGGRAWGDVGAGGPDEAADRPGVPSTLLGYNLYGIGEAVDCFFSAQTAWRAHFNGKGGCPTPFPKMGTLALLISCSRQNLARKEAQKFYYILWAQER